MIALHLGELSSCHFLHLCFGSGLVSLHFLVLQVIPNLFIWVPIWRIAREIKDMKATLRRDVGLRLLRHVTGCLIENRVVFLDGAADLGRDCL